MQLLTSNELDTRIKRFLDRQTSKLPQKELRAQQDRHERIAFRAHKFGIGSKFVW
jgi:hypothetical protein